jgi:Cu(I)/Ag(I) efflux system membrane fusion protein
MSLKSVVSSKLIFVLFGVVIGTAIHYLYPFLLVAHYNNDEQKGTIQNTLAVVEHSEGNKREPLYWVAPMDDNYRRDKPGKSPMGMDLVPVYENASDDLGKGTIKINPSVINNLGVRTEKVKYSQLDNQINTVGFITYNEDKLAHIHPRIAGWVEKLYVKATGDLVKKDQPLYELYSPELVNAQEEYLLTLLAKDNRLIQASESRLKALHIPQKIIDEIKATKQVKQNVMFTAPQSGIIKDLNIREGFYVDLGTKLFSIGDLSEVWVEAEVFERQYRKIHQGDKVSMNLDYLPEHIWQGEVDYIYPILDAKTRTVRIRLRFQNPDFALKPNMFAQVVIHDSNNKKQILIPKEALIRTGTQDLVVLAKSGGRIKSLEVKVGNQDKRYIEVLSGLNEGDAIVVSAQFLIDSESSKTSDFMRMSSIEEENITDNNQIWTEATINNVTTDDKMVTLTHQAIDEWDWPEMTMDFKVADNVNVNLLHAGLSLHVEITHAENDTFLITNTHIMDLTSESIKQDNNENKLSARVQGKVNSIDLNSKLVNISREAIDKWEREAATMDFSLSSDLTFDSFVIGKTIDFTFEIQNGEFIVTELHTSGAK